MNTKHALTITMIFAVASMSFASVGSAQEASAEQRASKQEGKAETCNPLAENCPIEFRKKKSDLDASQGIEAKERFHRCLLDAVIDVENRFGGPGYEDAIQKQLECRATYLNWIDSWYDRSILHWGK